MALAYTILAGLYSIPLLAILHYGNILSGHLPAVHVTVRNITGHCYIPYPLAVPAPV